MKQKLTEKKQISVRYMAVKGVKNNFYGNVIYKDMKKITKK